MIIICGACGHVVHAQVLAPGAGFGPYCPGCATCRANKGARDRDQQ